MAPSSSTTILSKLKRYRTAPTKVFCHKPSERALECVFVVEELKAVDGCVGKRRVVCTVMAKVLQGVLLLYCAVCRMVTERADNCTPACAELEYHCCL